MRRMTLVLDVDETLVHCSHIQSGSGADADSAFSVGGRTVRATKRPGLDEFLDFVTKYSKMSKLQKKKNVL